MHGFSYTNWYNKKTAIYYSYNKITYAGPFKCKDYDATIDITSNWPLIYCGVNREVVFGTACQLPDGSA